MSNYQKVVSFHKRYGHKIGSNPLEFPNEKDCKFRLSLIEEELQELKDAIKDKNAIELADAIGDLLYVVYGFGVVAGLPVDEVFQEIHESNMSKDPPDGPDSKPKKGSAFFNPDLKRVIEEFMKDDR